jgi:hypothetical protein
VKLPVASDQTIVSAGIDSVGLGVGLTFGILGVGAIIYIVYRFAVKRTMSTYYIGPPHADSDATIKLGKADAGNVAAVKQMLSASSTKRIGGGNVSVM